MLHFIAAIFSRRQTICPPQIDETKLQEIAAKTWFEKFLQIKEDNARLVGAIDHLQAQIKILKDNQTQQKKLYEDVHRACVLNQIQTASLDDRLTSFSKQSFDGILLWRIPHVQAKLLAAKTGEQQSVYSEPFFTSKHGYKLCARVYFNGDGAGKNTHLSVFISIMRGEYDALLAWPFRHKITIKLLDQTQSETKDDHMDAFNADPQSSSFKKPTNEINVASGLPTFCTLSNLFNFVVDDCMFLKIIVS